MKHTTMQSYAGQELCPRCGVDANGNTWPDCTNGHPHAETCAKQNIGENLCARCERELNTLLPTCVELSGKSKWEVGKPRITSVDTAPPRWRVERHATLRGRGTSEPATEYTWCAFHTEDDIEETHKHFATWQEAMDHADRMARTYGVVLPRAIYGDHVVAGKGLYSLHVDYREHCTDIYLGGWDGVTVENSHLMDLAVYLAGCAKHWEEQK